MGDARFQLTVPKCQAQCESDRFVTSAETADVQSLQMGVPLLMLVHQRFGLGGVQASG